MALDTNKLTVVPLRQVVAPALVVETAWLVSFQPKPALVIVLPPTPIPPPTSTVFIRNSQVQRDINLGTDISTFPGLDPSFGLISGFIVLSQAVARRFITPRGSLPFEPDYGTDLRQFISDALTDSDIGAIKAAVEGEAEKDERVEAAFATVTYNSGAKALSIQLELTTSQGPFPMTLKVTELEVALLSAG